LKNKERKCDSSSESNYQALEHFYVVTIFYSPASVVGLAGPIELNSSFCLVFGLVYLYVHQFYNLVISLWGGGGGDSGSIHS
jgi:hypothetical protein